jgi:hypothetical protein
MRMAIYILRKIEVKSWVALYPGSKGGHATDPKKYGNTTISGAFMAKLFEFQVQCMGTVSVVK